MRAKRNRTLTTSSLGANFPEGIPIGKVFELEGGEDGLFKIGQVSLNENLSSILEVTVLTDPPNIMGNEKA